MTNHREILLIDQSCDNCIYFLDGHCAKRAPQIIDRYGFGVWPKVKSTSWCGDWRFYPDSNEQQTS